MTSVLSEVAEDAGVAEARQELKKDVIKRKVDRQVAIVAFRVIKGLKLTCDP